MNDTQAERGWTPWSVVRLALANGIGFSATMSVPFWLGAVSERFALPVWSGAALATGQLICLAAFNILTPWLFPTQARRHIGAAGAGIALAGNLVALVPHPAAFIAGCLLAGCGLGVMLNVTNRMVTEMDAVERTYSLFQIVEVAYSMAFMLVVPMLIARSSVVAIPVICAALALFAVLMIRSLPETRAKARETVVRHGNLAGIQALALAGMGLLFIGQSSINAYIIVLATRLQIPIERMGQVMATGLVFGLGVGAVTRWMGNRFGVVGPLWLGASALSISLIVISMTESQSVFLVGTIMMFVWSVFNAPFAFAMLANADATGRTASVGPAFLMIGVAIGPIVGSTIAAYGSTKAIGWVAAVIIMLAALSFHAAGTALNRARG